MLALLSGAVSRLEALCSWSNQLRRRHSQLDPLRLRVNMASTTVSMIAIVQRLLQSRCRKLPKCLEAL